MTFDFLGRYNKIKKGCDQRKRGPLVGSVVNMDKNLKKVATYSIDKTTQLCDVKTARENLKECKSYIIDDAIDAFESTTMHLMTAVEYINIESANRYVTVSCAGYVYTSPRTAGRWWFCYFRDVISGESSITILDDNDEQHDYKL